MGEVAALGPARRDDGRGDAAGVNLTLVEERVPSEDEGMLLMAERRLPGFGKGQVRGNEHLAGRGVDFRRSSHHRRVRHGAEELQCKNR